MANSMCPRIPVALFAILTWLGHLWIHLASAQDVDAQPLFRASRPIETGEAAPVVWRRSRSVPPCLCPAVVEGEPVWRGRSRLREADFSCNLPRRCHSLFFFGGALTSRSMRNTLQIVNSDYDGNYIGGLGFQRYPWAVRNFHLGWEVGGAGRFGDGSSAEVWGGPTIRYDGLTLGRWKITPSFTAGLSYVTNTMGNERHREQHYNGDASLLFYLGPENGISHAAYPNIDLFYRLHHRSGANGTLGGVKEGYNANVVGVRFRY